MKSRHALRLTALLSALLPLLLLSACDKEPQTRAVQPPVVQGETIHFQTDSKQLDILKSEVVKEERTKTLRMPGRLVWDETRTVRVFAPVGGRIAKLLAEPGQAVARGAPLALLASADLGQAQADARRAQADDRLTEKNLARQQELHAHGVVALKDLQSAQADHDRAAAELARTLARLRLYGAADRVDQEMILRSPVSGVVVERNANPGQEIRPDQAQPGAPALFVVTDPTHLWAQIDASEAALPGLHVGERLNLRSDSVAEGALQGQIQHIADFVDPQSRTVKLRASVDNSKRLLKAESFVTAEINVELKRVISVPTSAVLLIGSTKYVFLNEGEGTYRRVEVDAGEAEFGRMHVRSGLAPGQQVVTQGGLLLLQIMSGARR